MQDLREFLLFLKEYTTSRLLVTGHRFEKVKDIIVALLIVKRGKYSSSFLNTTFFLLVATVFIGGPTIAENNPLINSLQTPDRSLQQTVISYNPLENPLSTVVSLGRPRDSVINYTVKPGDTLASIAKNFGISVDTIKWANDLKTETIHAGNTLKIPPVTGVVHKVVSGENVYTIAKKYKVDPQKIVNFPFNDFTDLDTFALASGQTLYVPDGVIEEEQPKYAAAQMYGQIQAGVKGSSQFIWPTTGVITQYPIWYHMALDIANPSLPGVVAAGDGVISLVQYLKYGYGQHIMIAHDDGLSTLYGHLSEIYVKPGDRVSRGQVIGKMGSTGRSTGPHLHFEVRKNGVTQNPVTYLK
jgi:murein DD-endopeptidase MepM/ murein hydrolase activator NlpD